jgi:23S rRNA (guanosine2251-2'-O)-methyltransferase
VSGERHPGGRPGEPRRSRADARGRAARRLGGGSPEAERARGAVSPRTERSSVIYGRNPVREALRGRRARAIGAIWATEQTAKEAWLTGTPVTVRAAEEIAARCGSESHQGICAEGGHYPYVEPGSLLQSADPLIVVLDQVQDPQNLGSIARTAESAGASGLVIHERGSAEVTPAVCKASAGAVEHLALARVRNVADFIGAARNAGCWSYGAVMPGGQDVLPYGEPDYSGGVVLVLGSEGRGIRPRVAAACDQLICLPMHGRVQSLGVSAAAAALLYRILQDRPSSS